MGGKDLFDRLVFFLLLGIVVITPLIISLDAFHPYVSAKETAFLFLIIVALIIWISKIIITEKVFFVKNKVTIAVSAYALYTMISYLVFQYTDRIYILNLMGVVIFYFLITNFVTEKKEIKIIILLWALTTIPCIIYGTSQYFGIDYSAFIGYFGERDMGRRVFSFFGNPNIYAVFLAMSIPIIMSLILMIKRWILRIPVILLFIAAGGNLLLTQTRGGWIGLGSGLFSFLLFYMIYKFLSGKSNKELIKIMKHPISIIVSLVIIIIIIGSISGVIYYNEKNKQNIKHYELLSLHSVNIRFNYWRNTLGIIKDHPIFGTGTGTFNVYYPAYRDKYIEYKLGEKENEYRVEHPHNEFLEIMSDNGIIGLGLFLCIIISLFYFSMKTLLMKRESEDRDITILLIGCMASLVGVLAHNLFSQNLRFIITMIFMWLNIGVIVSINRIILKNSTISDSVTTKKNKNNKYRINLIKIGIIIIIVLFVMFFYYKQSLNTYRSDTLVKVGLGYYTARQHDQAIDYLQKAVKLQKDNKRALYYIGLSQLQKSQHKDAEDAFNDLLMLDNNFISAQHYIGICYLYNGDVEKAIQAFENAKSTNNMFSDPRIAQATILQQEGKYRGAIDNYKEVLWITNITGKKLPENLIEGMMFTYKQSATEEEIIELKERIEKDYKGRFDISN